MKRLLLTLTVVAVSALTMYGQSRINFNNFGAGLVPVTVGSLNQGATGGAAGDFAGSTYSVQLLWAAGTFANQGAFNAANPSASALFPLFGTTGNLPAHGPTVDGTGLWDGGTIAMGGPAGTYTLQARVWYNNGQYSTYALAAGAGVNVGLSALTPIAATESPTPAPDSAFSAFTVGVVPEPSTFALAGLGAAALLLFRRRK